MLKKRIQPFCSFLPVFTLFFSCFFSVILQGQTFVLPTPNDAILKGDFTNYFVGTVGRDWTSGTFGCVRSDGFQMHEGLDIKCVQRDKKGEPLDPVYAAAAGKVAYLNPKAGLSN